MKFFTASLVLLFSLNAWGEVQFYILNLDLNFLGQKTQIPALIVQEGKNIEFLRENEKGQKSFVDIVLTDLEGERQVKIEAYLGTINEGGKKVIHSSPKVITLHGTEASISQGYEDKVVTKLSVTPEPIQL